MREDLLVISYIVLYLVIWFDTSAFVEYAKLFKLKNFFHIDEYEKANEKGGALIEYYEFLDLKYSSFITRLFSCQFCCAFWLAVIFGLAVGDGYAFPLYFVGSIMLYLLIKLTYK